MSREILFKGKRVDNGEWVEGDYLQAKLSGGYFISNEIDDSNEYEHKTNQDIIKVNPKTVSQYTGLKDKNGVKIFEGDMIEFKTIAQEKGEFSNGSQSSLHYGNIGFDEGGFGVIWNKDDEFAIQFKNFTPISRWFCKQSKTIGNIHEVKGEQ